MIKFSYDRRQNKIFDKTIKNAFGNYKASVGYFEDKNREHKDGAKSSQIALCHETGSMVNHLPQRKFISGVFDWKKKEIVQSFQQALNVMNFGKNCLFPVLKHTGNSIADFVLMVLNNQGEGRMQLLSERTIKKKGHDKLLEDEGLLKQDLQSKVIKI